ncbi:DAYSLEEPER [Hibiscus trionum]|uniref:DAYSLEEPER n=1 Tax=Hibiscus trionum TaxID=183268 RepID=A0A9W7HH53_HIBTR|nr:DAYSLEEPER [Hibiscus trionum]
MLVVDELPFAFVEREGFIEFCQTINPLFSVPSRTTATRDCYALFIEQRNQLKYSFKSLNSRVSLTTDTWTSSQNLSYMCLPAHFIDDDWNLHKRIINFCPVAGHSGQLIGRAVEKCLNEWGLKNIMIVTVDNARSNDLAVDYLRRRLNIWESSLLGVNICI